MGLSDGSSKVGGLGPVRPGSAGVPSSVRKEVMRHPESDCGERHFHRVEALCFFHTMPTRVSRPRVAGGKAWWFVNTRGSITDSSDD